MKRLNKDFDDGTEKVMEYFLHLAASEPDQKTREELLSILNGDTAETRRPDARRKLSFEDVAADALWGW